VHDWTPMLVIRAGVRWLVVEREEVGVSVKASNFT
jgi:hypothetical protein